MSPLFQKKLTPEEIIEKAMNNPDPLQKKVILDIYIGKCKGKRRHLGFKIVDEVVKSSDDPVSHLYSLLRNVRDSQIAEHIVDRIAGYGLEQKEVHGILYQIGDPAFGKVNRAARKKARQYYDKYWYQVTGGNPLASRDLLIPSW
jgi:hypothetical protein